MARLVFRGGNVFDGTGSAAAAADVAVEDGRIVEVGTGLDGDDAVELDGATLLPGLFDCHVHVAVSHIDGSRLSRTPTSVRVLEAARNMEATLRAGITSVRDAGGADMGLREAQRSGLVKGPRMQVSLSMLSQTGGHGDDWLPSGDRMTLFGDLPGLPDTIVDGPDEMRKVVRELIRNGADVIKVATSGGVLSPSDDPRHAHFRPAELDVLVEEATAAGRFVMAHAQGADGIKNAVRAGIRSIEHGIYLDDEAIELMLGHGTWLVATLVAPLGVLEAVDAGRLAAAGGGRQGALRRRGAPGLVPAGRRGRGQDRDGHRLRDHRARAQPPRARADGRRGRDDARGRPGGHDAQRRAAAGRGRGRSARSSRASSPTSSSSGATRPSSPRCPTGSRPCTRAGALVA